MSEIYKNDYLYVINTNESINTYLGAYFGIDGMTENTVYRINKTNDGYTLQVSVGE